MLYTLGSIFYIRHNLSSSDAPKSFFFNDTATTEIYTLSLHDALPIFDGASSLSAPNRSRKRAPARPFKDRKSTRLNSSHVKKSYAVFCLKKKNNQCPERGPDGIRAGGPDPVSSEREG